MAETRLPLLRDKITAAETYSAPQGRGKQPPLPSLDPKAHRTRLLRQLDALAREARERSRVERDELADRELVAVRPAEGVQLVPDQLDNARSDARLVGVDPDTGVVLLDVASPQLDYLREKIEAFGDDTKAVAKFDQDGSTSVHRASERAIAPINSIGLANLDDRRGPRLRTEALDEARAYWFEIGCRGGYRRPEHETNASRVQVRRFFAQKGWSTFPDEFVAPEQIYFFARLTPSELRDLLVATDCVYEAEFVSPGVRDFYLFEEGRPADIRNFVLEPPPVSAPAVVVLDSGIASSHPLLARAVLSATTASSLIPSPEDTDGHGTKMAGIALHHDLGSALERGRTRASHWIQSSRLLVKQGTGTAHDDNYPLWPVLTVGAINAAEAADPGRRNRVFAMAVTRSMQEPPLAGLEPTLWSHAMDQLAFGQGTSRLLLVSAGNARYEQWLTLSEQFPDLHLSEKIHQPAQAANVLTVGAFTARVELPPGPDYAEHILVATRPGGISPYTSAGLVGSEWPIKPDIVMEGGNLATAGGLPDPTVPTLTGLTTGHRHTYGQPLAQLAMTSEATARAANLAARIWVVEPSLRPETVRGLLVHSASWTPEMMRQFESTNDRLLACGYGVPDERLALECTQDRATIVVEDEMPNGVIEQVLKKKPPKRLTTKQTEAKLRRKLKIYRLPIPTDLLSGNDEDVELRVTLSYFAEPNKFRRSVSYGLDLKWDMQGPQEDEEEFLQRINVWHRPTGPDGKPVKVESKKSFNWVVGIQARSRGTVQSDRWKGKLSALVGDKLIAVCPVLGWWDQRKQMATQRQRFSLIVSVVGPGVYTAIRPRIELPVESLVEV